VIVGLLSNPAIANRLSAHTVADYSLTPKAAVRIAGAEYDRHRLDVVVGSTRGGAVAMNLDSGDTPLVLLCPA
jgi:hypothetical protein